MTALTELESAQAHMPKGWTARIEREPGVVRVLAHRNDGEQTDQWAFEIDDDEDDPNPDSAALAAFNLRRMIDQDEAEARRAFTLRETGR